MAAMLDEDVSAQQPLDMGMAAPLAGSSVLAAQPSAFGRRRCPDQPPRGFAEPPYTGWQIAGLAICTVLLLLCGMMMFDLLRSMWSCEQPHGHHQPVDEHDSGLDRAIDANMDRFGDRSRPQ